MSTHALAGTIEGVVTLEGLRSSKDVVVYIKEGPNKEFLPSEERAIIDQKGLTFIPHILPILKGTTVSFLNSDTVAHNVFTPDAAGDKMNLGTWQRNEVRNYTFNKLGSVNILCALHPEMSGFIIILQNPYFAVTGKDGNFVIRDVPSGRYTLSIWHERAKIEPKEIVVEDGVPARIEFHLINK